ncbi:hypothetical protein KR215_010680 [Drosophila sulfurigaster]|nr:hypothetical protein KR215_010680 [Drosophila sulfurigaster]
MVFVTFRFEDGTNPEAVQLQPDTIYRIGRKQELEFHSDDESLELAHATIALIAGGIVRIAAVAGKVIVNGSETEIQSISNSDIVNCLVDLKFGNVKAKLSFKEDKHDEAVSIQDKTVNKTGDSLVIPESMPPSANTTFDCDSFNIPETQAVPLHRQSRGPEVSKVSLDDDDFLIPETQEVLPQQNLRPDLEHKTNVVVDDDSSELGSQIRICTQEFNEFDEDAIDDFDSSLLLGDVAITVLGKGGLKQPADNAAVDQEVSALNWSATNTKYSAVNSTKLDEEHARNEACLTPELSAAGIPLDDVPCTPDLFDFINNEANQSSNSPPHELINVTADVHRNSVCRAEKSAVNSIETPDNTPGEANDNNEDFIETQAFPMRKLIANDDDVATQAFNRNASWNDNDDFIATQVFPKRTSLANSNLEDNIATQAFIRDPEVSKTKPKEADGNNSNTSSAFLVPLPKSAVNNSENFNNSNTSSPFKAPLAKPAVNDIANNSEDLIATQVFFKQPRVSETITKESTNSSINNNDDMQETQLFIPPKTAENETLEYADEKTPLSSKMSRQAKSKSEAIVDQTASARSESDAKTRSRKVKSNEKLDQAPSVRSESETKKGRSRRLKTTDEILHEKLDQAASGRSASEIKRGRPKKLKTNDVILHETKDQAASVRSESDTKRGRPSKFKTNDVSLHETKNQEVSVLSASEVKGQRSKKSRSTDECVPEKVDQAASSRSTSKSRSEKSEIIQPIDQVAPPKRSKRLASLKTDSQSSEAAGTSKESTKETDVPPEKKVKKSKIENINKYIMKIKRSGRKIQLSLSMCNYAELRQILHSLRNEFEVTDDPRCCDVLLMDRGERTYKFLIGIASNRPILSSCWLHDIKENRSLAVKANHIFKDYKFMELFKFNPLAVLEPTNLLKGFNFMLGTDIQPNAKDMQGGLNTDSLESKMELKVHSFSFAAIIECAGGTVHRKAPPIASNVRLYVVASQKDKHMWQLLRNYTNLEYIKTEGVMQALVQHRPELLDEHKLIRL